MNKSAKLVFAADGKTAHIVFGDEKENDIFESKNQVLRSLGGMIRKGKLTEDEAIGIARQALDAQDLPMHVLDDMSGSGAGSLIDMILGNGLFGGFGGIIGISISVVSGGKETFSDIESDDDVKEPMFRMCACGDNHGWMLYKDDKGKARISNRLDSKYEAKKILEKAKKKYGLSDEDAGKLIAQIELSKLPEFANPEEESEANSGTK